MALFALFALAAGLTLPMIGWHLLAGFLGLGIGLALFACGYIGGGDAKLFAAMLLWLGFADIVPYALFASLFGGALTLGLLFVRHLPLPALLARQGWILRLHDEKSGIPMACAAMGAFWILPHSQIFSSRPPERRMPEDGA